MGDEPSGGEAGLPDVPVRQAAAGGVELAGHPGGDGLQLGVQDLDVLAGQRAADRIEDAVTSSAVTVWQVVKPRLSTGP